MLSSLRSNLGPAINCHPNAVSQAIHQRENGTLDERQTGHPIYQHKLVDVKDPTEPFFVCRVKAHGETGTLNESEQKDQWRDRGRGGGRG